LSGAHQRLDGPRLQAALRAGIAQVLAETDALNRINVYPVADGDTGTNLALTLGAVDEALGADTRTAAGEVLAAAADAALEGARGNSGAIMAEFLQGLADATADRAELDAPTLGGAFANADRYARGALDAPEEGTILSVIAAVAAALTRDAGAGLDTALRAATAAAATALEATRETLPAMRRAGVVDAGARGFTVFLDGFVTAALDADRGPRPVPAAGADVPMATPEATTTTVEFRFCTECIVAATAVDRRRLHDALGALGDSLVIAGRRDKLKLHIHTDDPAAVFALAARFGKVSGEKADDIRRQTRTRAHAGRQIAVVTDSGADLPEETCDELDIHMVPLRVHFADRTYLDKVTLTPAMFLREVAASPHHPRTSQPAPGDLRRVCDFLASHHEHVIAVTLDARVSGTWQATRTAARRSGAAARITVIDSRNASVGQGLVALRAAECARAGLSLAETLGEIGQAVAGTRSFGVVANLDWAARGGRLPRPVYWLATLLPVRPVLTMGGGAVGVSDLAMRWRDPVAALLPSLLRRRAGHGTRRFAIAHSGMPEAAARLAAALGARAPDNAGVFVCELGAAASVHAGPRTLAAAVQECVATR
jgi:DegV family protein with EDD domain